MRVSGKYFLLIMMTVVMFRHVTGKNVIKIPSFEESSGPITWYAHFDLKCMFDAHVYCATNYQQGRLLTYGTNERVQQIYDVAILDGMEIWSGLYVADVSTSKYQWAPCEPYNASVNLNGVVVDSSKRCFVIHLDNKDPHVHAKGCTDVKPYVCMESNVGGNCNFKNLMTTLASHTEVSTLQECKDICKSNTNCWAFLYTLRWCFLFRNTNSGATETAEMEEKYCPITGPISTSVNDPAGCTNPNSLPSQYCSASASSTDTTPHASGKLCEDTFHTETLLRTVVEQNFVTVPSIVYATNYLTAGMTVTVTQSEQFWRTLTHTETVQPSALVQNVMTVPVTVYATNYQLSTFTVTKTVSDVVSVFITQNGAPQSQIVQQSVEFVTRYVTATETISITQSSGGVIATMPCSVVPVENVTTSPIDIHEKIQEIKGSLTVHENSTSRHKNTKVSVYEERAGAKALGFLSMGIVACLFILLLYNDLPKVIGDMRNIHKYENTQNTQ